MKRLSVIGALALLVALPAGLLAQDRGMRVFAFDSRARIGVTVDMRADAERDKLGARIESVMSDSPAEKAGLKGGDVITKFGATALGGAKAEDKDQSGPGQKLVELARKLEPGDTVRIEYRRDGQARNATVVAADLGGAFSFRMPQGEFRMPQGEFRMVPPMEGVWPDFDGGNFDVTVARGLGGLELATLSPELGEYFGTKDGVLVVRAPKDSASVLRDGDVILSIDGRKPQSPSHARRILGSYQSGETAKVELMRKQRRTTVTWTAASAPGVQWHWRSPEREMRDRTRTRIERS